MTEWVRAILARAAPEPLPSAEVIRRVRAQIPLGDDYLAHLRVYGALIQLGRTGRAVRVRKGLWALANAPSPAEDARRALLQSLVRQALRQPDPAARRAYVAELAADALAGLDAVERAVAPAVVS